MTKRNMQGDAPSGSDADPYGDDQGTRVGKPSTPNRDNAEPSGTNKGGAGPGTEPIDEQKNVHKNEHKSGYGGEGGAPRTSSDQR